VSSARRSATLAARAVVDTSGERGHRVNVEWVMTTASQSWIWDERGDMRGRHPTRMDVVPSNS
jgi:hypothetical protein